MSSGIQISTWTICNPTYFWPFEIQTSLDFRSSLYFFHNFETLVRLTNRKNDYWYWMKILLQPEKNIIFSKVNDSAELKQFFHMWVIQHNFNRGVLCRRGEVQEFLQLGSSWWSGQTTPCLLSPEINGIHWRSEL